MIEVTKITWLVQLCDVIRPEERNLSHRDEAGEGTQDSECVHEMVQGKGKEGLSPEDVWSVVPWTGLEPQDEGLCMSCVSCSVLPQARGERPLPSES